MARCNSMACCGCFKLIELNDAGLFVILITTNGNDPYHYVLCPSCLAEKIPTQDRNRRFQSDEVEIFQTKGQICSCSCHLNSSGAEKNGRTFTMPANRFKEVLSTVWALYTQFGPGITSQTVRQET